MAAPIHNIKVGNVQLAIWENKSGEYTVQSITVNKTYKDKKSGEYKQTNSFKFSELPFLALAIEKAMEFKYVKDTSPKPKDF